MKAIATVAFNVTISYGLTPANSVQLSLLRDEIYQACKTLVDERLQRIGPSETQKFRLEPASCSVTKVTLEDV